MSTGIDFVIGGKDKAGPAVDAVAKSLQRLEQKTDKLGAATSKLTMLTGALAAAYGAVKAGLALLGGIDKINAAYDQQADAVRGLETALRLQGEAVDSQSPRLQAFASDLQKLTGVGDELTIALMKQASMLGVGADDLDDMAKAAVGLGEVMGTSAESGMEMMRRAQEGNFMAFQKMFPVMKEMQSDTEKLAFVTELAAKGLEAKADASLSVSGMAGRASGAVGDLMEMVGALIAPVRILISQGIKTLAESLQTLLVPAVDIATSVLENIGPMMDWVKEKVIQGVNLMVGAFTFFEVVIGNLDKIWVVMVSQAELYLLQMSGAVMHALTVEIPAYASWFGENFVNLISDGLSLAFNVVKNSVTKIIDAFRALWDFIASGGTTDVLGQLGDIAGRSYLEGFESSLTALPDIATRQISEREKELARTIGEIGANLGDEFATKFASRMVGMGDGLSDEFDKTINLKVDDKLNKELGIGGKGGGAAGPLTASESRLLTRGPADKRTDLMQQILNKMKELLTTNKNTEAAAMETASNAAQIAENTSQTTQMVSTL